MKISTAGFKHKINDPENKKTVKQPENLYNPQALHIMEGHHLEDIKEECRMLFGNIFNEKLEEPND